MNSMKILYGLLLLLCLTFFIVPPIASAHFPATDKDIVVVLHVDPDDDPIPTQKAILNFEIVDNKEHFIPQKCNCTLRISEQGREIYITKLSATKYDKPTIWNISVPFTFPKRDVYRITLTGTPKTPNLFQSFSVGWDFRVNQSAPFLSIQNTKLSQFLLYLSVSLGTLVIFFGIFFGIPLIEKRLDKKKKKH